MEDSTIKLTRFLLESARAAHRKGKRFEKLINKLRSDVEKLDEEFDRFKDDWNSELRDYIFQLHDIPEDKEDAYIRDPAQNVMSTYFFENKMDIETCMAKLAEQLSLIKEAGDE
jgi:hypothetical protein